MIAKLGPGLLGLVVASLIAAYMSTIGTHLNWGSSYAVNDFYKRFVRKEASEKEMVNAGRICTVVLMFIAGFFALTFLEDAGQAFKILLLSGAGTGAIYILRWFWWRINAWTEIVAIIVASVVAFWIVLGVGDDGTLAWYMGSSAVQDRVYMIDDKATVDAVVAQRQQAQGKIAELEDQVDILVNKWRKARKESDAARDIARVAYDTEYAALNDIKNATSVAALVNGFTNNDWRPELEQFYVEQNQWQLERTNKKRDKSGLDPKMIDEISVSFAGIVAGDKIYIYHPAVADLNFPVQLLVCVFFVTVSWLLTTFLTPAVDKQTLRKFYKLCHPGGPGWSKIVREAREDGEDIDTKNAIGDWKLPTQVLCVFLGCVAIYGSLFAVGNFVYGNIGWGIALIIVACVTIFMLFKSFGKIGVESGD